METVSGDRLYSESYMYIFVCIQKVSRNVCSRCNYRIDILHRSRVCFFMNQSLIFINAFYTLNLVYKNVYIGSSSYFSQIQVFVIKIALYYKYIIIMRTNINSVRVKSISKYIFILIIPFCDTQYNLEMISIQVQMHIHSPENNPS